MRHEVQTSEGVTLEVELAGAGTRFLAAVVDLLLLGAGLLGVLFVMSRLEGSLAEFTRTFLAVGVLLLTVGFQALVPLAMDGRTPGKRLMGVRILALDGGEPGAGQVVLRALLCPVDYFLLLPIPLGLLVIATGSRRQRLGDLAAGTLVVREPRARGAALEPWSKETWSGGAPGGAAPLRVLPLTPRDARRFDREDLLFLRSVVTRRGVDVVRRRQLFREVAQHYLERLGHASKEDPRVVLKEIYLFLREHLTGQPSAAPDRG